MLGVKIINQLATIYELYLKIKLEIDTAKAEKLDNNAYEKYFSNIICIFDELKLEENILKKLQEDYIKQNGIKEFTKQNVKVLETESAFKEFSETLDKLTEIIVYIKKQQDDIISEINKKYNVKNMTKPDFIDENRIKEKYKKIQKY